jgi:PAS domain S-box-containing protein
MRDDEKSREQLLAELTKLRRRTAELEAQVADCDRAGAETQRKEHLHRTILDTTPDLTWVKGLDGHIEAVNQAWLEFAGLDPDEMVGRFDTEFFPPEAIVQFREDEANLVATGKPLRREERVPNRSGVECTFDILKAPICDSAGRVIATMGIARDITERKRAEEALRQSEYLQRAILDNIPDPAWVKGLNGRNEIVNKAWLEFLGMTPEEGIGRSDSELFSPEIAASIEAQDRAVMESGKPLHWEESVPDQRGVLHTFDTFKAPLFDTTGRVTGTIGITRDITERKRTEETLRNLSKAVTFCPSMIMITDQLGRVEHVNPAWEQCTGYRLDEVRGQKPQSMKSGLHTREFYAELWDAITAGRVWRGEFCNRRKTGELYWEAAAIAPVQNDAGIITHFVAAKEDITSRRQAAQELRDAKEAADAASRAKGDFLANMSHEIRTPLNAIIGFSQLLLRNPKLTPDQQRQLTTISRSGEHLLEIIDAILEISRIDARRITFNPVDLDLHQLLDDLERMLSLRTRAKQLRFRVERQSDLPRYINTDKTKLHQILINLLANAVKFTPDGGEVTLRVRAVDEADQTLRLYVEVEDSGIGIVPKDLTHLFEPFFQAESARRATDGAGLGLSISREYVRLFGGELTATSQPGLGSTFRFDFRVTLTDPVAIASERTHRRRELYLSPESPVCRVLVVDDCRENCERIEHLLVPIGFEVRGVANGLDAVSLCQSWLPNLVVIDFCMPAMEGHDATRRIRAARGWDVKILALSASVLSDDTQRALDTGSDAVLRKPFRGEELLDLIKLLTGIEYLYDDSRTQETDAADVRPLPTAENLSCLPPELTDRLREASLRANHRKMHELIREVQPLDALLADQLRNLVQRFDFNALQTLLGKPESRETR